MEDVFGSPSLAELTTAMMSFLCGCREYEYLSIDATIKCCVACRTNPVIRNMAPFDDATAYRRVLTVRGRTGAVLGMIPVATERAEEITMALGYHLPSKGLNQVLRIMPNLQALCLDAIDLSIVYECFGISSS